MARSTVAARGPLDAASVGDTTPGGPDPIVELEGVVVVGAPLPQPARAVGPRSQGGRIGVTSPPVDRLVGDALGEGPAELGLRTTPGRGRPVPIPSAPPPALDPRGQHHHRPHEREDRHQRAEQRRRDRPERQGSDEHRHAQAGGRPVGPGPAGWSRERHGRGRGAGSWWPVERSGRLVATGRSARRSGCASGPGPDATATAPPRRNGSSVATSAVEPMDRPRRWVPLREPRSATTAPLGRSEIVACRRDTVG